MSEVISKTTYVFTVLHRTDSPPRDLHDAVNEAYGGHAVGNVETEVTVPIPNHEVAGELRALGNDGEFFIDDMEEAEEA